MKLRKLVFCLFVCYLIIFTVILCLKKDHSALKLTSINAKMKGGICQKICLPQFYFYCKPQTLNLALYPPTLLRECLWKMNIFIVSNKAGKIGTLNMFPSDPQHCNGLLKSCTGARKYTYTDLAMSSHMLKQLIIVLSVLGTRPLMNDHFQSQHDNSCRHHSSQNTLKYH